MQSNSEMLHAVWKVKPHLQHGSWLSFVISLLILVPSVYMLEVYDRVVTTRSHTTLLMLTLLVVAGYLIMELLDWSRHALLHQAGDGFDHELHERIHAAQHQAALLSNGAAPGNAIADLKTVKDLFTSPALVAVMELPASVILLVVLFAMNHWLGWLAVGAGVVQVLLAFLTEKLTQPPLALASKKQVQAQAYATLCFQRADVVAAMGMTERTAMRWQTLQNEFLAQQSMASKQAGLLQSLSRAAQNMASSALLGLGCWLLLNNEFAAGAGGMIVASILGGKCLSPLIQMIAQWRSLVSVRQAWGRLDALLHAVPKPSVPMPLPAPQGWLRVEGVSAAAPGQQELLLKSVSTDIKPGQCLAVVGPTGSGKSTLARLLVGLWPARHGKVRLDGVDVHTWNKAELGPHLGYLPQTVGLLDGSIAQNIARYSAPDAQKLQEVLQLCGLDHWVAALPEGIHTRVGLQGAWLSGGQRQQVGIARAFYGFPQLIVLDEPDASLDEAADKALLQAIQVAKGRGCTLVINTHRTALLRHCDRMMILVDGTVQMQGSVDEVMAKLKL